MSIRKAVFTGVATGISSFLVMLFALSGSSGLVLKPAIGFGVTMGVGAVILYAVLDKRGRLSR